MDALFSKSVKSGKITYFFDVREAKNQKKYLTITASQPAGTADAKFTKRSINVFSDAVDKFAEALTDAVGNMK
ncbi:MAG: DUF3276 family protein [bacterium]